MVLHKSLCWNTVFKCFDPPQPPLKRGEKEEATLLTSRREQEESTPLTSPGESDVADTSLFSKNWGDSQPENNSTQKAPLLKGGWGDLSVIVKQ